MTRRGVIPDLIKIDTEGSELSVLRGGRQTLREHHPKIVLELNPQSAEAAGTKIADYLQFFRELGYRVYTLPTDPASSGIPQREFDERRDCPNGRLTNVVCISAEDPDMPGNLAPWAPIRV